MKIAGQTRAVLLNLLTDPVGIASIAQASGVPKGSLHFILHNLVDAKLAKRSGKPKHFAFALTKKGEDAACQASHEADAAHEIAKPNGRALKFRSRAIVKAVKALEAEKRDHLDAVKAIDSAIDALEL